MDKDDRKSKRNRKTKTVHGLCLFGCACDGCLVVGAGGGGRPPDDEGGGGRGTYLEDDEDRHLFDSESSLGMYVTSLQMPFAGTSSSTSSTPPDRSPQHENVDMFVPVLGPGQCGRLPWTISRLMHTELFTPCILLLTSGSCFILVRQIFYCLRGIICDFFGTFEKVFTINLTY